MGRDHELRRELAIEQRRPASEALGRPMLCLGAPVLTKAVRNDLVHFLSSYAYKDGPLLVTSKGNFVK